MMWWKRITDSLLLIFTVLLPLKFTHALGIPAVPASYWGDFFSLIHTGWSPHIFALVSGCLLTVSVLQDGFRRKQSSMQLTLWMLLAFTSLAGCVRASALEYVRQTLDVIFGLACFAGTVFLAIRRDETFAEKLKVAMAAGVVLCAISGWNQIAGSMEDVREYVKEKQLDSAFSDAMNRQIASNRIYGTFQLSNTYAGYLAAFLPLLVWLVVRWAGKHVKPERPAQWLLGIISGAMILVPMIMTGSRGAILSLTAGLFTVLFLVGNSRQRKYLAAGGVFAAAGITLLIIFWRGAESLIFRLDYDFAALKMMLEHPFTGTGWGDFFHEYPAKKLLINDETPHSPHNLVLFFGSQSGLMGFLLAAALPLWPLYRGIKALLERKKEDNGMWTERTVRLGILTASMMILTIDAMLEVGIESPAYATALILFSSLIFAETGIPELTPFRHWKLPPVRHAALAVVAIGTAAAAGYEICREKAFSELYETVYPQFSRNAELKAPHPQLVLQKYRNAPQDSPFVHLTMAAYLEMTGNDQSAIKTVEKAIILAPEDISAHRRRHRLLKKINADSGDVRKELNWILNADPNNPANQKLQ